MNIFNNGLRQLSGVLFLLVMIGLSNNYLTAQEKLPPARREFRAVWIATVDNIDFPTSKNLTTDQQKAEIIKMLDLAQKLKFNAVIFQVRPHTDALYDSKIEPWSEYLTGVQGRRPQPFYDPLKFITDEAHKRGLLLHAWFNPYRAQHPAMKGAVAENHISKRRPELVKKYGRYMWLDPGESEVQDYSLSVIKDVVRRYDVDGVHFDDYFYPYAEKDADGKNIPFPDDESWAKYLRTAGQMSRPNMRRIPLKRDDWRRSNVDNFIQRVAVEIKKIKPKIMFGVSPFGIWQPMPEKGIQGFNAYAELYADARKWLQEGWVDYLAPQLYWSSQREGQKFPVLLDWWKEQNIKKRHLWVGIADYRIGASPDFTTDELINQIETTRRVEGTQAGTIHFSFKQIQQNRGNVQAALAEKAYTDDALIPASSWLSKTAPSAPVIKIKGTQISWQKRGGSPVFRWILYWKVNTGWKYEVASAEKTSYRISGTDEIKAVAVVGVDRLGNESKPTVKTIR